MERLSSVEGWEEKEIMEREVKREREREYPGIPKAYSILPFFKFDEMRQRMVLVFLSYFVRGFCYLQMLVYPVSLYIIWYVHILMNYSVKQYFCMNR